MSKLLQKRSRRRLYTGLTLAALSILLVAARAQAITVEELISNNIKARGGAEKLQAIHSAKTSGILSFTGDFGANLNFTTWQNAGSIRQEASLQGLTVIQAYDGQNAWQINPFQGRKDPEKMSADDAKGLLDSADIAGPLFNYAGKGNKVEYLGTEDVDGTDAQKLKVTLKNGDIKIIYLDPDQFLEIRILDQRRIRGELVETETDLGSYEQIAGVYFPFSIEVGSKGSAKNQKVTIEKMDVNVDADARLFQLPPSPAAK